MLVCPRCSRAGNSKEDVQTGCVDKQTIGCPTPRDVVTGKDIVIQCRDELCGKLVAVAASSVMHRTIPTEISCMRTPCSAMVFNQPAPTEDTSESFGIQPRSERLSKGARGDATKKG